MKFGAVLPTCETGTDPIALRDWAQAAESLGYAHIVTYDHVLGARDAGFSHFSINCQSTTCEWGGNPAANLGNTAEHIAALESFITSVR
ncbi:hypothetical protein [Candidatus Poriferisodalis sp.]|uniref:hypothetical protein n=1 Tax=Candidatus Poriferisodalis sp. TaxID=3101277 RepID=UPI003B012C98